MRRHLVRTKSMVQGLAAAALAASVGVALPALPASGQEGVQPFILYEHAPLSTWLVDDKDAGLKQALSMIPARISELPGEVPDMPAEVEPLIQLALRTLAQPARFSVTYNPDNAAGGFFGYGLTLSVQARDKAHATELHGILHAALLERLGQDGMPEPTDSSRFNGMKDITLPFGLASYGPREDSGGWRYEVVVGAVDNPSAGFDKLPSVAAGLTPVMRGSLHMAALTPGINMARTMAGKNMPPEGAEVISALESAGIIGPEAISVDFVTGYTATDTTSWMRVRNAGKYSEAWHMSREPVGDKDLAMVPADATMLAITKGDLSMLVELIDTLTEKGVPVGDFLAEFKSQTGVDLKTEIIQTVGGTWGAYMSDSTGGGSLGSGVLFASLKDRATFAGAHRKLVAAAREKLSEEEKGIYIRPKVWKDGDVELMSLQFPGLPVPLEVTYAVAGDWLIAGLTPQAVIAASRQALGKGDRGITTNPTFAAAMPKGRDLMSVSYADTARSLRAGYPIVSMAGSAFANLARSPRGDRDVGVIVPLFNDLARGVKPMVQFTFWDGEDLVTEGHSDRSALVNFGGVCGSGASFWPLMIAIPAIAEGAEKGRFGALDMPWKRIRNVEGRESALALLATPEMLMDPVRRQAAMATLGVVWQLD